MIGVITGDLINSKKMAPSNWLKILKKELSMEGNTPEDWEIYRGDSFQIEIQNPEEALAISIRIKAAIKSMPGMDVRMAIGIGDKTYPAKSITEANGSAFIYSGQLVEELKKMKLNLAMRSNSTKLDQEINLYLKLALLAMDSWTITAAETIHAAFIYPEKSQEELGRLMGIRQNAISTRLKRARYYEILELIEMYRIKIKELNDTHH